MRVSELIKIDLYILDLKSCKYCKISAKHNFVPQHLGLEHVTIDTVIQKHTRPSAKELVCPSDENAILVLDGTMYIYLWPKAYILCISAATLLWHAET